MITDNDFTTKFENDEKLLDMRMLGYVFILRHYVAPSAVFMAKHNFRSKFSKILWDVWIVEENCNTCCWI